MEGVFNVTDNLKIFARRLKELRNEKGITQGDLELINIFLIIFNLCIDIVTS